MYRPFRLDEMQFQLPAGDLVTETCFRDGMWEPHFRALAERFVGPGDVVCDAGAHFGLHTLRLAQLVGPTGKVLAFEPQREIFQLLCFHTVLNGMRNVWTYPNALGEQQGGTSINTAQECIPGNCGASALGKGSDKVQILPLDVWSEWPLSFLKIDVQGSELMLLRGAETIIANRRPWMFIEIEENWLRDLGSSSEQVIDWLFDKNYSLLKIETDWPTDHFCFPRERADEVLRRLEGFSWNTQLLEGKRVKLTFSGQAFYDSFEILG